MRKMVIGAWVIGILLFSARETECQCSCAHIYPTAHRAFKSADAVFTGEIIEVKKGTLPDEYKVEFRVRSVWKKDVGELVLLRTYRVSCGFFGEKGEEYLVYAYAHEGMLYTSGCTHTKLLAKASADLEELKEEGEKPVKVYEAEPSKP